MTTTSITFNSKSFEFPNKNILVVTLTGIYFVVSLIGIFHHELWLDEAHHWLLARDSGSIARLIDNSRLEGHPLTWDFLLFAISRITCNPFWMQLFHICISTSAIFIFLKKAPFSVLFKFLFIFGYFMLFEYNLISRNYILGILFLFIACSLYANHKKNFIWICLFLGLAANIHVIMAIPALALMLMIAYEEYKTKSYLENQKRIIGFACFAFLVGVVALQFAYTDSDWLLTSIKHEPFLSKISPGFISLFKGLFIVPDFSTMHFWNTNIFMSLDRAVLIILGLIVYAIPFLIIKKRKVLLFVYTALAGLQLFLFFTQRSAARFDGIAFLIIIMGLWLDNPSKQSSNSNKVGTFIIYPILIIQFASGITAFITDLRFPFTAGKAASEYLETNYPNAEIATLTCDGALISAYLNKKIYSLCSSSKQSYCVWDSEDCRQYYSPNEVLEMFSEYSSGKSNVIFVSSNPDYERLNRNATVKIVLLQSFETSIVRNSVFSVYEVTDIKNLN